jgi:hypothetical protein
LRYQGSQSAGKNAIINGGMDIWQRGTSYALPASAFSYGAADRWGVYNNSVTGRTISRQTSGLSGFTYSLRLQRDSGITTTQNTQLVQVMESSVSTSLQGQYVTVSFWAKAGANYSVASSNITVVLYAGTGTDQNPYLTGYTSQTTPISTSQAITTSWAKYSFTTSAVLASSITELTLSIQSGTFVGTAGANDWFEVTGVQLEAGQTGTLFTRAGGTIQGELAACQRYFYKAVTGVNTPGWMCAYYTSSTIVSTIRFPVTMRTSPTFAVATGTDYYIVIAGGGNDGLNTLIQEVGTPDAATIYNNTQAAGTIGYGGNLISNNASASIAWSAEL